MIVFTSLEQRSDAAEPSAREELGLVRSILVIAEELVRILQVVGDELVLARQLEVHLFIDTTPYLSDGFPEVHLFKLIAQEAQVLWLAWLLGSRRRVVVATEVELGQVQRLLRDPVATAAATLTATAVLATGDFFLKFAELFLAVFARHFLIILNDIYEDGLLAVHLEGLLGLLTDFLLVCFNMALAVLGLLLPNLSRDGGRKSINLLGQQVALSVQTSDVDVQVSCILNLVQLLGQFGQFTARQTQLLVKHTLGGGR